jgi:S-adenosyl methyltransferase
LRDWAPAVGQFAGLDLLDPGVVPVSRWRPDTDAEAGAVTALWGGVARKP